MITIIAAVSGDGFIGKDGKIPWRLKSDMEHFKRVTTGHTVVMGRKTWDSLGPKFQPLPNRRNIVITRQENFLAGGAEVVRSLTAALELTENDEHAFIIGGGEIYQQALPFAERLLITFVNILIGTGTTPFPEIDPQAWNLVSRTPWVRYPGDEYDSSIRDYSPNLRYIELANVRSHQQLTVMREIRKAGHCPFCEPHLWHYHKGELITNGYDWILTTNQWPYPGTDTHLLLISRTHAERIGELPWKAQEEFLTMLAWVEKNRSFPGGAVCMRSGDPLLSGATVKHLHAQIVVPWKGGDPVKFFIGTGKR